MMTWHIDHPLQHTHDPSTKHCTPKRVCQLVNGVILCVVETSWIDNVLLVSQDQLKGFLITFILG